MYTVYKTVNLVNGKYYIGVHKTDNPHDGYLGSGKLIKAAIAKYGADSFKKEIIAVFEDRNDAYELESKLVVICEDSYNIKAGGEGGFDYINQHNLTSTKTSVKFTTEQRRKGGLKTTDKYRTDVEFKKRRDIAGSNVLRLYGVTFAGRQHSEESKQKIGESNRVSQTGRNNSQYGTCWITNGTINKKIKLKELTDYEVIGWYRGRI